MKRNVAGQHIGAQMVSATDGSAFSGSVTVYVTGDAGTQAAGSVGSGACAHKGNGFHEYAPAQAETNYDHIAFTFVGSGAVPATVQVFPNFPQTVDNATGIAAIKAKTDNLPSDPADESLVIAATDAIAALIGAPAGASLSADVAAVKVDSAAILLDTAEIGTAGAGLTAVASAADLATLTGYVDTEVADIKAYADRTVIRGTVSGTSPTTTSFTSSALSPAGVDADQFKGRIIVFDNATTTAALRGQATDITASTGASNPLFTFSALTTAPQSGDTFSIV